MSVVVLTFENERFERASVTSVPEIVESRRGSPRIGDNFCCELRGYPAVERNSARAAQGGLQPPASTATLVYAAATTHGWFPCLDDLRVTSDSGLDLGRRYEH